VLELIISHELCLVNRDSSVQYHFHLPKAFLGYTQFYFKDGEKCVRLDDLNVDIKKTNTPMSVRLRLSLVTRTGIEEVNPLSAVISDKQVVDTVAFLY